MSNCSVCGKPLPAWFRGEMCSGKCRQKKSRDKKSASRRAAQCGKDIDTLIRAFEIGAFGIDDALHYHNQITTKMRRFHELLLKRLEAENENA